MMLYIYDRMVETLINLLRVHSVPQNFGTMVLLLYFVYICMCPTVVFVCWVGLILIICGCVLSFGEFDSSLVCNFKWGIVWICYVLQEYGVWGLTHLAKFRLDDLFNVWSSVNYALGWEQLISVCLGIAYFR